ncbi:hypothetical protein AB0L71_28470 [Streptomyces sp. NPDC052052]|uniref:hypothetical protein n=1 Tax=Streptomyces sp. NPDC052052 TaxID=3154756 RepID=UPI003437E165
MGGTVPQYVGHIEPAGFDPERGRLDLRPGSHAYAAQLRILGGQLAKQINDKVGTVVVRSIRILPVGAVTTGTPAVDPVPAEPTPAPGGPVRTRETASPGYHRALAAARAHKPDTVTNPHVRAAIDRQDQALADPHRREPEAAFTDAVAALEALTAGQAADGLQASIRAALDRKHGGAQPVRRAFDAA